MTASPPHRRGDLPARDFRPEYVLPRPQAVGSALAGGGLPQTRRQNPLISVVQTVCGFRGVPMLSQHFRSPAHLGQRVGRPLWVVEFGFRPAPNYQGLRSWTRGPDAHGQAQMVTASPSSGLR